MRATCPVHIILFDPITFGLVKKKMNSSTLISLIQLAVTSYFLVLYNLLSFQFFTATPSNIPALRVVVLDKQALKTTKAKTCKMWETIYDSWR